MPDSGARVVYYHTDHGPEIYPRAPRFTPEEAVWRKNATAFVMHRLETGGCCLETLPDDIAQVFNPSGKQVPKGRKHARLWLRDRITDILLTLRIINEVLHISFRSPDWGISRTCSTSWSLCFSLVDPR